MKSDIKKEKINVFWFRRDLRLIDNCGLFYALNSNKKVLPIFIFDTQILNTLLKDDARVSFIHQELLSITNKLVNSGSSLAVFKGNSLDVFKKLTEQYNIKTVYTNNDYEPYAIKRDLEVKTFLTSKSIKFSSHKDQVIFEKNEIVKQDKTPYKVFTPYFKKWLAALNHQTINYYPSENKLNNCIKNTNHPFISLKEIGFQKSLLKIQPYHISNKIINNYECERDFPSKNATSKIGIHLRFGTISIRKIVNKAIKNKSNTFLKELIWREFFMQILWHFPLTTKNAFKPKYDKILWRNNENEFNAWCNGKTGYPIVDAGMRELNKTGFMHNRVRMITASFLCKHLLIDWKWGETYFAEKLLDYELASNIGNWQWIAGCGVDAAPYFRIFNPKTQIIKFDKDLKYIKKWIPEYQKPTYTKPIVDHKFARERCLNTYKKALY